MAIHYLPARHARKEGDTHGCNAEHHKGTVRVSMNIDEVTCHTCKNFYWHHEGVMLSAQATSELAEVAR